MSFYQDYVKEPRLATAKHGPDYQKETGDIVVFYNGWYFPNQYKNSGLFRSQGEWHQR